MTRQLLRVAPLMLGFASTGCSLLFAPSSYPQTDVDAAVDAVDAPADAPQQDTRTDVPVPLRTPWPRCDGADRDNRAADFFGNGLELGTAASSWVESTAGGSAFGVLPGLAFPETDVRAVALAADHDTSDASLDVLYAAILTQALDGAQLTLYRIPANDADTGPTAPIFTRDYPGTALDVALVEKGSGQLEFVVATTDVLSAARRAADGTVIDLSIARRGLAYLVAYANQIAVGAFADGVGRLDSSDSRPLASNVGLPFLTGSPGSTVYSADTAGALRISTEGVAGATSFAGVRMVSTDNASAREYSLLLAADGFRFGSLPFDGNLTAAHAGQDHRDNAFIAVGATSDEITMLSVFADAEPGPAFVIGTHEGVSDLEMVVTSNANGVGAFALSRSATGARLHGFRVCVPAP